MQHREKQLALVLAQTLPAQGTLERVLLDYAACWGPDAIPKPWIEELLRERHAVLLTSSSLGVDLLANAWAWLGRRRLLTSTQWPELLRLHRLIAVHLNADAGVSSAQVLAQIDVQGARLEQEMHRHQPIPEWRVEALQAWASTAETQESRLRAMVLGTAASYVAEAHGVSAAALLASQSLRLFEALAQAGPSNALARADLSNCLNRVGDIKAAQGDAKGAISAHERSLAIAEILATADSSNHEVQRLVLASLDRLGNIKAEQGDAQAALAAFQRSLDIAEGLSRADPGNVQIQRDVSVSLLKIGNVKAATGDALGDRKSVV